MRGHKYRAWDKRTEQMVEVIAIVYSDFQIEAGCDDKLGDPVVDAGVWINALSTEKGCLMEEDRDFKDVELMQYTGLKDKNGKEIYEGDIVSDCYYLADEEDWHYLGPSGKGVVIWDDDHAGFQIETNRWDKEKTSKALPEHTFHQIVSEWVEIIGNIYENPELAPEVKP